MSSLFINSILAGILISVTAGIVGSYVVTQRKVFIAGGIAHTSYGGLGIAYYLGFPPMFGGLIFALLASLIIGILERKSKQRIDTIIGVIWAVGMAIGIIFVDLTKGYVVDLMSFLFGSIVAISSLDLYFFLGVNFFIVLLVYFLFKDFLAYSFDPEFSELMNKKNRYLNYLFLFFISLSIVVMIRLVGLILIIALLTIPPSISERYTKKLKTMMILSIVLSMIFITTGLFLSYYLDLTAGALIVLISGVFYLLGLIGKGDSLKKKVIASKSKEA